MLCAAVQEQGHTPVLMDAETPKGREQLLQLAYSGAGTFLAQGTGHAVSLFAEPAFGDKTLIGFSRWGAPRLPGQHLILSDLAEGGRMAARHLYDRGHRRILVVTGGRHHISGAEEARDEDPPRDRRSQGAVFLETAEALGCAVDIAHARLQKNAPAPRRYEFQDDDLLSPLRSGTGPATAIFGTMDIVAYCAREQIRAREPGLLEGTEVVGFYDTPWSQAGETPFTSVSLNLEELVEEASALVQRLDRNPKLAPVTKLIRPRLTAIENEKRGK
jgi:DNA-binding LacI/PurR family transcriptional regulator